MLFPKPEDLKTRDKGIILVSLPLLVGTIFLSIMSLMLSGAQRQSEREAHTQNILFTQNRIETLLTDNLATTVASIFFMGDQFDTRSESLRKEIDDQFDTLKGLVAKNPALVKRVNHARQTAISGFNDIDEIRRNTGGELSNYNALQLPMLFRKMQRTISLRNADRKAWAEDLHDKQPQAALTADQWSVVILIVLIGGLVLNIGLSIAGATFFSGSMSKRLNILVNNSIRFASDQPLLPPLQGKDEIAALDAVFHQMTEKMNLVSRKERAIVDNTVDVICSIDANGRFTAVNPASLDVWGYEADELLGRRLVDIVVKEDTEKTLSSMKDCQKQEKETVFENQIKRKDGSFVSMLWSIYWSSSQKALFCVAHDITERLIEERYWQESEARVRLMLQSMPVGLIICSEQHEIEIANIASEEMFGLEQDAIVGRDIKSLFLQWHDEPVEMQDLGFGKPLALEACTASGGTFPTELTLTDFYLHGQQKLLVMIADVSARREVERVKQDFVAMVSHDLRSPLTSLNFTLQNFESGKLGDLNQKGKNRIKAINTEVTRLINLINNLLDIEKLESNRMDIKREVTDLVQVVRQSLESVGYLAEKNGVNIVSDLSPCEALADASSLVQVMVNLLANAVKFSPAGSTITVTAKALEGAVEIAVQDQGRGIPEEHRQAIFDRFKQVEIKDRTEKKGSGLGLAICKAIVTAHGGEIGVDSEPGRGSRFWFSIPVEE